jgi:hypothetical protein
MIKEGNNRGSVPIFFPIQASASGIIAAREIAKRIG